MIYKLDTDFTKIEQTEGLLENKSAHTPVEILMTDGTPEKEMGVELQPKEKLPFRVKDGQVLYARAANFEHSNVNLAVANFNVPASGGAEAGDLIDDSMTVLDKTWSSEKIEEELNSVNGKDGVGIADITYNITMNTLDIELTDGTTRSFPGLGTSYFGGFKTTVLFKGSVDGSDNDTGGIVNLPDDILNYDYLLISCKIKGLYFQKYVKTNEPISLNISTYDVPAATGVFGTIVRISNKSIALRWCRKWGNAWAGDISSAILGIYGIRGEINEKVLWEGKVGSVDGQSTDNIDLTESLMNYRKLGIKQVACLNDNNGILRPQYYEFLTDQLDGIISEKYGKDNTATLSMLFGQSFSEIQPYSTMQKLVVISQNAYIEKIIGIK